MSRRAISLEKKKRDIIAKIESGVKNSDFCVKNSTHHRQQFPLFAKIGIQFYR